MRLWLRIRRVPACLLTILVVAIVLVPLRTLYLPAPNLLGGFALTVPLALLLPITVAIVMAWGLTTGEPLLESVASRPIHLLDGAYALATAILALLTYALVWKLSGVSLALAAGRNTLGYVGLTLIGRSILGSHAASAVPASFVVMTSLFGSRVGRQPVWWAWPLAPADDPTAWSMALALLTIGAMITLRQSTSLMSDR